MSRYNQHESQLSFKVDKFQALRIRERLEKLFVDEKVIYIDGYLTAKIRHT